MEQKSLLLHTCCAPCTSYVYELLINEYNLTSYYYNPNISPDNEYDRRLEEVKKFAKKKKLSLIIGDYDNEEWTSQVKAYSFLGERSERCWLCYRIRLEETFKKAAEMKFDIVCTTLSISPHKDAEMLNKIGKELEQTYGMEFLEANFKKNDGYKKSLELSKKYGFYRQRYCGCIYSMLEKG